MLRDRLGRDFLLFDGAMGTQLQSRGLPRGRIPEEWNITHPEVIKSIHEKYLRAGADFITTNTFGCNPLKTADSQFDFADMIRRAVNNAKEARRKVKPNSYIVLDIGPIGQMLRPLGPLSFDEAYDIIAAQVRAGREAGADAVLLETMTDLREVKAGMLAVKENCDLPLFVTMTFGEDGRTLTGADPMLFVTVAGNLGADMLGANCSLGPREIKPVAEKILKYSPVPVMIQPNAGMPAIENGETVYHLTAEEFVRGISELIPLGARVLGGCCGSTPEFIEKLSRIKPKAPVPRKVRRQVAAAGAAETAVFGQEVLVCGERLNPTGQKALAKALREGRYEEYAAEAVRQQRAGAQILDVNTGLPGIDEKEAMVRAIERIQEVVTLPLMIDSRDPEVIRRACRIYNGRPVINSVNGKESTMAEIFPIAKKYGALVVGLCIESGVPEKPGDRAEIAGKIISKAEEYGIPGEDIIVDCLTLAASAQPDSAERTLQAIRLVKEKYGAYTLLGVSNISFGLPGRPLLNRTFLSMALEAGLDMPIINPLDEDIMNTVSAYRLLSGQDRTGERYILGRADISPKEKTAGKNFTPSEIIYRGLKDEAGPVFRELLRKREPMEIINGTVIPALDEVGKDYQDGKIFLPQLIQSAEAAKAAFEEIKSSFGTSRGQRGPVLICTVEGDVHDIGKNIVKVVLESYGWNVIDLGKDVPAREVVEARKKYNPAIIGLSALMTTTVPNMEKTIKALKKSGCTCPVWVGGAVMTEKTARDIGADYYTPDALASARLLEELFPARDRKSGI